MRKIYFLLITIMCSIFSFAQEINGTIVDEFGNALPGVNIQTLKSNKFATSNFDGSFTIQGSIGEQIKFSMIGMEDLIVEASQNMNVTMLQSVTELETVVMIGYGTAKKRDLTGSIVSIKGEEVADKPNNNVLSSLQGKVAGLSVVNSGQPGSEPDVRIRGTISLYQTKPLYVIDGIFSETMDFVNPNDIKSIEVLKDPSSLSVFGARGANGVILVTTKRARNGETQINYNTTVGYKNITGKPDMTNAEEFKYLYDMQRANQGASPYPYYNLYNADTDWVNEIANDNALFYNHNISFSNASEKNSFYAGFGYSNEEGLIKNELYKKFTASLNDELQVTDYLKLGVNVNFLDARLPRLGGFNTALNTTPLVAPFNNELGVYNQLPTDMGAAQLGNALLEVEGKKGTQLNRNTKIVGSVFAEVALLKNLKFRGSYLASLDYLRGRGYLPVFDVYAAETDELVHYSGNVLTKVNQFSNFKQNLQQDYTLTYQKEFGKHDITLLAGHTRYNEYLENMSGTVSQYAPSYDDDGIDTNQIPNDPRWWYLNVFPYGDPTTRFSNSTQWDRATMSNLARILYNYDGKYMLNASFRNDDSSELRKDQNFWAVGAAWEISKESFFANKYVNYLKIKGSMGEQGNQFSDLHYPTYPLYIPGQSAVFGEELVPAYILAYRNNPNLEWETVTSKEIGFELGAFDNKLSLEVNYYDKTTNGLIAFIRGTDNFYGNLGKISNNGLEFVASWKNTIREGFDYTISGNLTTLNNKVHYLNDEGYDYVSDPTRTTGGQPISYFYGYVVEGVYQTYADVLNSPISTVGDYTVGDFKYKDVNGDGQITPEDRTNIGNPTPDFTYGFSAAVNYNSWNLGVDFQGVYGNEVFRNWGNGSSFAQFNFRSDRLGAWTGEGTSNWEPRMNDASGYNRLTSSYMVEDGSYLRLRNVQLGYTFKNEFLNNLKIKNLKMFINAQNMITWKNNSGFTPEFGGSPTSFGVDGGSYPVAAITTLGINVTF
ncbi:SusC/RagA family TonB-linked outer membrane protein [Flavobacterium sp. TP390]|uniref:SusC/RagA family TonB-linked outer membrane protein n=1 Tax=Flavobacterium profundi TaxID=1774945 RepID=A0A6I4IMB5_9FLAO|nr:TonB-dependent receptor [Flavobacterium profundi]MVO09911.1 SusC/RagA family TonB-linked outer membrane protein [Flavobacterium profundi]